MPLKIGYKVTTKDLYSKYIKGPSAVKYIYKKWVRPQKGCGSLAVFTSLESARLHSLSNMFSSTKIFKCHYYSTRKPMYGWILGDRISWTNPDLPDHTDFASSVKLVERIK